MVNAFPAQEEILFLAGYNPHEQSEQPAERETTLGDLTEHFSAWELTCPCGRCSGWPEPRETLHRTAEWLEEIRVLLGGHPLRINSGYRCIEHNRAVGGAGHSEHLYGRAADIVLRELSPATVQKILRAHFPTLFRGLGLARGYTHVDRRPGLPAIWRYGPDGQPRSVR